MLRSLKRISWKNPLNTLLKLSQMMLLFIAISDISHAQTNNLDDYAIQFCADKFGEEEANEAAEILSLYCKYASRISAEMLDHRTYNLENGEFLQVKDAFLALETHAMRQYYNLAVEYRNTYNNTYAPKKRGRIIRANHSSIGSGSGNL